MKLAADNDVELSLADAEKYFAKDSVMLSEEEPDTELDTPPEGFT